MGLLDTDYAAVNSAKPRKSNRILPGEPLNVRGLLDAATNIPVAGDALSGGLAVYDAIKGDYPSAAMNAVSILPGVSAGMVGMFAGKGAKTYDALKAAQAEKMIADGVDRAKVWQETGYGHAPWQKPGTDAAVRHELDDSGSLTKKAMYTSRQNNDDVFMSEAMAHKPLYKAYPDSKDVTVNYAWKADAGGNYNPSLDYISVGYGNPNPKSTTLHELQHAIQQREGWARGGSPESFASKNDTLNHYGAAFERANIGYHEAKDAGGIHPVTGLSAKTYAENRTALLSKIDELKAEGAGLDPNEAYKRLAGEAEARLTQYRMNLSPEERLAQYPYDPEYFKKATGVDIDKLIVRGLLGE